MGNAIKYMKVRVTATEGSEDRSVTESYYEELANRKVEFEKIVECSKATVLTEVIEALGPITQGTALKVQITIERKSNMDELKLTKYRMTDNRANPHK